MFQVMKVKSFPLPSKLKFYANELKVINPQKYIYYYIYVCMCVCVWLEGKGAWQRKTLLWHHHRTPQAEAKTVLVVAVSNKHTNSMNNIHTHTYETSEEKITILLTAWETFIKYSVILSLTGA